MTLDHAKFAEFTRHRVVRDLLPEETYLQPVRDHIDTFGWHIQSVFGDAGRFGWNYTIGFSDSLGHPDLVVFGLPANVAHALLNDIGDAIAAGQPMSVGKRYDGFLVDLDIEFQVTLPQWSPAHFGRANDWYGAYPTMWQVVVPDAENRFPGDPGEETSRFQLLLSSEQPAPYPLSHPSTPIEVDEGHPALVPDLMGQNETGWDERVVLIEGVTAGRWIVVSVPYVDHLGFGDEVEAEDDGGILRVTGLTQRAPFVTLRMCLVKGGEETQQRLGALIDLAEANEIVWESPVQHWIFFAVPNHRYAGFLETAEALQHDGLISLRSSHAPPA